MIGLWYRDYGIYYRLWYTYSVYYTYYHDTGVYMHKVYIQHKITNLAMTIMHTEFMYGPAW